MHHPVVIIGAGPAGLTAAYELVKNGIKPIVFEKGDKVGGISRTETYKGYHFDIGGHRFFTKVEEVQQLWLEVLGDEFIKVPRLSRIYYKGKYYNYPLSLFNTLSNLGIFESFLILLSYLQAKWQPNPVEENLEQWVINRFGKRLYKTFFKTYTEKVWGIPCNEIQAEWAAQRIKGLSLKKAITNALFGTNNTKTLIKEFDYPVLGPGMMWQKFQAAVEAQGGQVDLNSSVVRLEHDGKRIERVIVQQDGKLVSVAGDHFISSMPIATLIHRLDPLPPDAVLQAARNLNYRDFLIVALIVNREHLFPDNWIYIHSPEVKVGRIQNFKNWSAAMVPDPTKTCLGMEYFCTKGDGIWTMSDTELLDLATSELAKLGLANAADVEDGVVIRQPKAYPVYDHEYRRHLKVIQDYLATFENLQTTGRNGMHRYNNQDHSMLTGWLAAKNILGENHDLWEVNTERSYYEEFTIKPAQQEKVLAKV
ncbi:NAD(P)/FAD-dependent oxidoreductase [Chroococcidiopsis sp. TS-821]|uniref:NAD(P)/FAD-dependent oxidoreductase n=1 Tax=Chroococcidiopsis sp. TS-821 TaxID=1378066 RepID=UPI000CEDEF94|nr:NAD(P)/FAD-dependent oxidoreductase [Chroococcidiopsis sp. TS-821]PPS45647.1 FAD-dependent oxidoreductase [Chroococcidiopsis sp. TS-821]